MSHKEYLGDGVYVEVEHDMVKLTTSNGVIDINTIYLEELVLRDFLAWTKRVSDEVKAVNDQYVKAEAEDFEKRQSSE